MNPNTNHFYSYRSAQNISNYPYEMLQYQTGSLHFRNLLEFVWYDWAIFHITMLVNQLLIIIDEDHLPFRRFTVYILGVQFFSNFYLPLTISIYDS